MNDGTISVVVVEDEKLIAKNIKKNIEACNPHFKVVASFLNGADAWDYIQKQPPQVVFTDISMPVMNGIDLVAHIAKSSNYIRCVILTGYADFEYARTALRYGVEDYLLKPINKEELDKTLHSIEKGIIASHPDLLAQTNDETISPEKIVALIKEYVQNHYSEDISLNIIAQNLGYSPSYLTKVFNKVEGSSPSSFIKNYRMGIAKQLMNDSSITLASIAPSVGYQDPFHFSKAFKQVYGLSPSDYRKKLYLESADIE